MRTDDAKEGSPHACGNRRGRSARGPLPGGGRPVKPLWLAAGLAGLSVAISLSPHVDLVVASEFFCPEQGWCHGRDALWVWLYRSGPLLPVGCGVAGAGVGIVGAIRKNTRWRTVGCYLALNLLVGPGLLGNSTKALWGRPRPRHLEQFGGAHEYRPVWAMRPGGKGTSFPSGHVVTGGSLGALASLVRSPRIAGLLVVVSLIYGSLTGVARMAQGAHFLTDVAWSLTLAWVGIAVAEALALRRWPKRVRDAG